MNKALLVSMVLCFSVSFGFAEETALKRDDPRWALVEYWSKLRENNNPERNRELFKAEFFTLQELQRNKALIKVEEFPPTLDRDYYTSRYRKASVRIDGDWAVVYRLDENGRIDFIPEFVHRENDRWKVDHGVTWVVAFADPKRPVEARWFGIMDARNLGVVPFLGAIRLSKWLKKELNWEPR